MLQESLWMASWHTNDHIWYNFHCVSLAFIKEIMHSWMQSLHSIWLRHQIHEISIKLKFGSRSEQLASERKGITDQNANPRHSSSKIWWVIEPSSNLEKFNTICFWNHFVWTPGLQMIMKSGFGIWFHWFSLRKPLTHWMRALEQTPGRRRRRPGRARFKLLLSELRVQKVANEEFKECQLETLEKRRSRTARTESLSSFT